MISRLAALLLTSLVLVASTPAAFANEHDEEETAEHEEDASQEEGGSEQEEQDKIEEEEDNEDEEWEHEDRELGLTTSEASFEYDSRRDTALASDEIRVKFDAREARFEFDYKADRPNETYLRFQVDFVALAEHEDTDQNGRYDVGETTLARTELARLAPEIAATSKGDVEQVDVVYSLPQGGKLTLRFHIAARPTTVGDVTLSPTQAKYDVLIQDYSWTANASRLMLETRTRTTIESEYDEDDEGQPGIEFAHGDIAGYYRWLNTTSVDGRIEPVGAAVLSQQTRGEDDELTHESVILFSYAHGASITHDPSLGVERVAALIADLAQTIKGDWRAFTLTLTIASAIVIATAMPRLRRRE